MAAVAAEQTELDLFRLEGSPRGLGDTVAPDSAAPLLRSESALFRLGFDAGEVLSTGGALLSSRGKMELVLLVALNLAPTTIWGMGDGELDVIYACFQGCLGAVIWFRNVIQNCSPLIYLDPKIKRINTPSIAGEQ